MGARFKGWGIGLPERIVTNDELSQTLDTSDEWITERTGIKERRIGGTAVSLGVIAAREAIADSKMVASDRLRERGIGVSRGAIVISASKCGCRPR